MSSEGPKSIWTPARIDHALAVLIMVLIAALLVVFFTQPAFFDWAFDRHQNVLSWVARPLLVLPLCYAAWRHSLAGVLAAILAILTSMFWFPAPDAPRNDVIRFLAMERDILTQGWTNQTIFGAIAVLLYTVALTAAFWRRSWGLGFAVAALGAGLKGVWSMMFSPNAGQTVLPFALGGVIVLGLVLAWARKGKGDGSGGHPLS